MAELLSVQNWYSNFRNNNSNNNNKKKSNSSQPSASSAASASASASAPSSASPSSGIKLSSPVNRLWKTRSSSSTTTTTTNNNSNPPDFSLSTLRDPRKSSANSPHLSRSTSPAAPRHPDLSNEVAALSEKLIQSINNSSVLDDSLQEARQELDHYRARVLHLELLTKQHERDLAEGVLCRKADTEEEMCELREMVEKERTARCAIEKEKRDLEAEVETLTAALFEEANKMVIDAKKEREAIEKKNEQLRAQVTDTEVLLASHQEQLAQLKSVMQQMNRTADPETRTVRTSTSSRPQTPSANTRPGTATGPPATSHQETINRLMEAMNISSTYSAVAASHSTNPAFSDPSPSEIVEPPPAPPTSYSHLIKPICREDVPAYDDYKSMLSVIRSLTEFRNVTGTTAVSSANSSTTAIPTSIANRVASATSSYLSTSPTFGGGGAGGLTSSSASIPSRPLSRSPSSNTLNRRPSFATLSPYQSASSVNPPSMAGSPTSSNIIGGGGGGGIRGDQGFSYTALKETRFYKRIIAEDIEPALRLDLAPGLSWLTRRSVMSSISDGALIIEPLTRDIMRENPPCALCGERRPPPPPPGSAGDGGGAVGNDYVMFDAMAGPRGNHHQQQRQPDNSRTHGFKTSSSDTAQRYPLCQICLEKMRACCEFVGYLRLIVDGHVHVRDANEEKEVWEEIVKLRERIFWARIGGGVVPAFVPLIQQLKMQQREHELMVQQELQNQLEEIEDEEERRAAAEEEEEKDHNLSTSHDDSAISASSGLSSIAPANPSCLSMATTTTTIDTTITTTTTNDDTNTNTEGEHKKEEVEGEGLGQVDVQDTSLASDESSALQPQEVNKGEEEDHDEQEEKQQRHEPPTKTESESQHETREDTLAQPPSETDHRSSIYRRHLKSLSALSERSESSSRAEESDATTKPAAVNVQSKINTPIITTTDVDEQGETDIGSPGEVVVQEVGDGGDYDYNRGSSPSMSSPSTH